MIWVNLLFLCNEPANNAGVIISAEVERIDRDIQN